MRYDHPSEFSGNSMSLASVDDGSLDVTVLQLELVFQDEPKTTIESKLSMLLCREVQKPSKELFKKSSEIP